MSQAAAKLLGSTYRVDMAKVEIVAHGVPHLPLVAPDTIKPRLGLAGRRVILSFGLLGPGKGYESAIAAHARGPRGRPERDLRDPRRHPPGPAPPRGRGLPAQARTLAANSA